MKMTVDNEPATTGNAMADMSGSSCGAIRRLTHMTNHGALFRHHIDIKATPRA
jgi:hypothetical protein